MNSLLTFTYNWNINEDFVFDALLGNELVDKRISNTQAVGYSFNFPGWNHLNNASVFNSSHEYKRKRTAGNRQLIFGLEEYALFECYGT